MTYNWRSYIPDNAVYIRPVSRTSLSPKEKRLIPEWVTSEILYAAYKSQGNLIILSDCIPSVAALATKRGFVVYPWH